MPRPLAITLLGGRGMLGSDIAGLCRERDISVDVYDLPEINIADPKALSRVIEPGKAIINCAAYTNVEKAESEPELAARVNGEAVRILGHLAKAAGSPVIHISTDFVFDGTHDRPYRETDAPNPISVYGRTKYEGEVALAESGCRHSIIRVQWTYGAAGNNFVRKIVQAARTRDRLSVVDDQIGAPTSTREAAHAILSLVAVDPIPHGLYHFAAAGCVDRFNMARFVLDRLDIDTPVEPCKTSDFPSAAARPLNSRFDCGKIEQTLGIAIRPWQEPLGEYLEQL